MRRPTLQRIQRYLAILCFASLLILTWVTVRIFTQDYVKALFGKQIALISGHAGYDSGASCTDEAGKTTVTEASVNATVAQLVAQQLRKHGANVLVLNEFDERLNGLHADLLLSLHADSCIPDSGFKAARHYVSTLGPTEDELVNCLNQDYAAATGLAVNPNTITHNMTDYHAFREIDPQTPGVILEMGFLGGDQVLLVHQPDNVAKGIMDSLICFFEKEQPKQESSPTP